MTESEKLAKNHLVSPKTLILLKGLNATIDRASISFETLLFNLKYYINAEIFRWFGCLGNDK